jgi:Xaa-Pro dipeptidase
MPADLGAVPAGAPPDLDEKLAVLRDIAVRRGVGALVLRDPATLGWLFGARVHVPQTLDSACLDVVVEDAATAPRLRVVTNAIEAPRLRDTELAGLDASWDVVPWSAAREDRLPVGRDVGADRPLPGTVDVVADVAAARRVLTAHQIEQLRAVCRDAAEAATAAVKRLSPTVSEYAAAATLAAELLDRALDPVALFAAGHDRIGPHRHPLPTTAPLGRRGMLVCCARRHGLVASVTRIVAFEPLPPGERDRYRALLAVEAAFLDATRPGVRLGDAFAVGAAAYARHGFDPDEWHRHHQGGFSGLQPREFPAYTSSDALISQRCVVAWNVSGDGWKAEDTCLVAAHGPEPLVHDPAWPALDVAGRPRPDVLVL